MKIQLNWRRGLVSLVLALCLIATDSANAADAATPPVKAPVAARPPRAAADAVTPEPNVPQRHEQFKARSREGNVDLLFLVDSISDFWPARGPDTWAKFPLDRTANFGVSGERTEHTLWHITNGVLDGISPKVVVLMIGTNNIGYAPDEKPEWAAAGVRKVVATLREKLPQSKILLLAIFPRDGKASEHRQKVDVINQIIAKLDDGKAVRFLDVGGRFLDDRGEIIVDAMPDLLHPSAKGYQLWYDAMRPVLDEMMKP